MGTAVAVALSMGRGSAGVAETRAAGVTTEAGGRVTETPRIGAMGAGGWARTVDEAGAMSYTSSDRRRAESE